MRLLERFGRASLILSVFGLASYFALSFGTGGLWRGLEAAHAVTSPGHPKAPYDLTQLTAVNETLKTIRDKYVDPARIKPRQMFLSALNRVQSEVAQVIVLHEEKSPTVKIRVGTEEKDFRVDNVQGPWDVAARLREVFAFLQTNLKNTEVDLRDVEYAACNGILKTLDPHSVFLSPDAYREMNLSTSGHFGGLGIVISIRDQMLTIMRPMPGTPAGRSGLKRLDRIMKINDESTLNMPLDDAVARLRGKPGTKVTIYIHRDGPDGWAGSRPFELTREEIRIKSVESRMLTGGAGYVRVKQFQSSTSNELEAALDGLRKKGGLKGVVLDLRGNPGGLLDQAARVADRFLDRGVIVSTVGNSEGREEKRAKVRGTEPQYPLAVLVNTSSASASEIVAGALKNHERAIIVGQTTFGKGTVQLVFPRITPDGAALKLTIAQYLTPGDVSIQGVGVTPDIELDPMTADTLEMDLFTSKRNLRERDLDKSLANGAKRSNDRPSVKVRFNLPESERAKRRALGGDIADEFVLDFPIRFARDLVGRLGRGRRADLLRSVKGFIDTAQKQEVAAVSEDLKGIGIDWSAPAGDDAEGPKAGEYEVKVETNRPANKVVAGQSMTLSVTVKNNGDKPVHRLRAITKADNWYYDERELVFGKIGPGETKKATVPVGACDVEGRRPGSTKKLPLNAKRVCSVPKDAVTREDAVRIRFSSASGEPPKDAWVRPTVESLEQPIFAYSYQVVDDRKGNGDGQVSRGEALTIHLTVRNVGKGSSHETQANIRNLTGAGLLLRGGRFDISNMRPGDVRNVAFTLDVLGSLRENFVKLELSVHDRDLRVGSSEKITLPVARTGPAIAAASGNVTVSASSLEVRGQPLAGAQVVGTLPAGAIVERAGTVGTFTKIMLEGSRFGFVATEGVRDGGAAVKTAFVPLLLKSPPMLDVSSGALATRADTVTIKGSASDGDRVLDAYVFVGARKVFYQSNREGSDKKRLDFSFEAKLTPGVNVIHVVARENEDVVTRRTMVVRRDGPKGEALPTPKSQAFGADWEFSGPN